VGWNQGAGAVMVAWHGSCGGGARDACTVHVWIRETPLANLCHIPHNTHDICNVCIRTYQGCSCPAAPNTPTVSVSCLCCCPCHHSWRYCSNAAFTSWLWTWQCGQMQTLPSLQPSINAGVTTCTLRLSMRLLWDSTWTPLGAWSPLTSSGGEGCVVLSGCLISQQVLSWGACQRYALFNRLHLHLPNLLCHLCLA
jgi:hypothetical protein